MIINIAGNHEIDAAWHVLGPLLKKACERVRCDISVADLWQLCRSGNAFLVYAIEDSEIKMASVWQFRNYPDGTVLKCLSLGGKDISEWKDQAEEKIYQMAREGDAKRIIYEGRKGWVKLFSQSKTISQIYEIEV